MQKKNKQQQQQQQQQKHVLDVRRYLSPKIEISREESERVMGTRFTSPDDIFKTVMADSVLSNNTACISRV